MLILFTQLARAFIDDEAIDANPAEESPAPADDLVDADGEPPGIDLIDGIEETPDDVVGKRKRGKSWTWKFMERTGTTKNHPAICLVCQKEKGVRTEIKRYDGSTKLMIQHLRDEHRISEKGKDVDASTGKKNVQPYPPRSETRK